MKAVKAVQAVRQRVRVSRDRRIEIRAVPFQPGSEVDVIVVGGESLTEESTPTDVYRYTERLKKDKKLPRYSLREIEEIVHQSRGVRG
jgi:hypothetical protein